MGAGWTVSRLGRYTDLAMPGFDARLVEELGESHRHADDDAAQQQVEDEMMMQVILIQVANDDGGR